MPAETKRVVGSFSGIKEALGISMCPLSLKKEINNCLSLGASMTDFSMKLVFGDKFFGNSLKSSCSWSSLWGSLQFGMIINFSLKELFQI